MSDTWYAIALDSATDAHREAVQAIVRVHSEGWWHHFADLWIVTGHDPVYWRDLIKPTLLNSPAAVLVFRLPERANRAWAAARVPTEATDYLFASYSQIEKPEPTPAIPALAPSTTDDDIPF